MKHDQKIDETRTLSSSSSDNRSYSATAADDSPSEHSVPTGDCFFATINGIEVPGKYG
jgi:hypothetical protein